LTIKSLLTFSQASLTTFVALVRLFIVMLRFLVTFEQQPVPPNPLFREFSLFPLFPTIPSHRYPPDSSLLPKWLFC